MMKILVSKGNKPEDSRMIITKPLTEKDISERKILSKYKKIFRQKDLPMTQTCMCWGLDIGYGWHPLVDMLCGCIQSYIDHNKKYDPKINQVEAVQVKEKFGGLRFYTNGECERIDGMIWLAEYMSNYICESCGTTKNVTQNNKGWILTLCDECRNKKHETLKKELQDIDFNKDLQGKDLKKRGKKK